jgi:beta-galactosidase
MEHYDWNDGWLFAPKFTPALCSVDYTDPALESVRVPHTVKTLPFNYCNENDYQMLSGYRREFFAPREWEGHRVLVTFGAVAHDATVFCNGLRVAHHCCGYTAFTVELSNALRFGKKNVLTVRCDSRETLDLPPFGDKIDYLTYGGIYRAVSLDVKDGSYLQDVFIQANADGGFRIYCAVEGETVGCSLRAEFRSPSGRKAVYAGDVGLPLCGTLIGARPWSCDHPTLYTLVMQLVRNGANGLPDRVIDEKQVRFGFRTIQFTAGGLFLNGEPIRLRGLNRHQSYAYCGYAMPDSLQRLDAQLLKKELGCNAVRTSHYPQSPAFLDACDELGLLVFTEMPGWQHIGGDAWKAQALQNCREMVLQCRNHPSVFLWGVRINESIDDDEFYKKTNEVVHRLDPTRPTGGVRCIKKSHLLEDVYTYNDFSYSQQGVACTSRAAVSPDPQKGYLVSEYGGHMMPAKPFDDESHRTAHALYYAAVLNDLTAQAGVAGSFGWCMFDYNTHKEFGSGDRMCYHGVMDAFRNPKLTAAVFASQKTPRVPSDIVLEVSATFSGGDFPAGIPGTCWAFTNADSIKLYKNDRFVAEFAPDRRGRFGALAHPPIAIDDFAGALLEQDEGLSHSNALQLADCLRSLRSCSGNPSPLLRARITSLLMGLHLNWNDGMRLYNKYSGCTGTETASYRFDAIWRGRVVRSVVREPVQRVRLECTVHNPILTDGPTWDCAAVSLRAIDQNGNLLPYCGEAVQLSVEGPVRIIGPQAVPLRGGMAGTYLATTGEAGRAILHCHMEGALDTDAVLTVRKRDN